MVSTRSQRIPRAPDLPELRRFDQPALMLTLV